MSSPLPVNARGNNNRDGDGSSQINENVLAGSFDRAESIHRLGTSPIPSNFNFGTSPARSVTSHRTYGSNHLNDNFLSTSRPHSTYGDTLTVDMPEDEVAKAVKRHLVSTSPAGSSHGLSSSPRRSINSHLNGLDDSGDEAEITSVHQLPGGAITHDIYKWTESVEQEQRDRKKRSQSVGNLRHEISDPALANLKEPGGFRRHFVFDRAAKKGMAPPSFLTRSFVDFLALYGHFGGEDLSDDEDEDSDDEDYRRRRPRWPPGDQDEGEGSDERTALLRQAQENAVQGNATPRKVVFLLLKAFIGTGVMFLPKAFYNGGVLFSTLFLAFVAFVSVYAFLLLIETRNKIPASFGDIGGILYGRAMRMLVLFAIATSQLGFVCAYMVFVAESVQALIIGVTENSTKVPIYYLILAQVFLFAPLAMIRKIQKLSFFALIADAFILLGLVYLYYYDFFKVIVEGVGKVNWVINPTSFPMFIGTAVFTFEGVGLIIPIVESMAEPKKFPRVLCWTLFFVTLLFLSLGCLSYLAFGDQVQTVVLLNLPDNHFVNAIQGLYALAICLSIPLQIFPAIRIVETGVFTRSGKRNPVVKWSKNVFRLGMVFFCALVAIIGSADLDKFVSIIGSVCCIPLCFLFPPLFHLKGAASTFKEKAIDIAIITFGVVCMLYTSIITASQFGVGG